MTADVELLMQGCFEMYPRMRFRDEGGYGQTIVSVLEYTCAFDALLTGMYGGGSSFGEAPTYLPYMLLAFHRFCAQASKPVDLEFPRQEIDFRQQLKQNLNILKGSFDHMSGTLHRCIGSATALCHDYLSPLLRIISPVFRSVRFIRPPYHTSCRLNGGQGEPAAHETQRVSTVGAGSRSDARLWTDLSPRQG